MEKYGCHLAGEAADGLEAVAVVEEKRPDVLINDSICPSFPA